MNSLLIDPSIDFYLYSDDGGSYIKFSNHSQIDNFYSGQVVTIYGCNQSIDADIYIESMMNAYNVGKNSLGTPDDIVKEFIGRLSSVSGVRIPALEAAFDLGRFEGGQNNIEISDDTDYNDDGMEVNSNGDTDSSGDMEQETPVEEVSDGEGNGQPSGDWGSNGGSLGGVASRPVQGNSEGTESGGVFQTPGE